MRVRALPSSLGFAAIALGLAGASALAAEDATLVLGGETLARQWCAECHDVRRGRLASPNLDAPPFADIAADASITEPSLRAVLRSPHATMPHILFSAEDMDRITAYILSLKPKN
jgi:mono/diheme cytochrome c family protein